MVTLVWSTYVYIILTGISLSIVFKNTFYLSGACVEEWYFVSSFQQCLQSNITGGKIFPYRLYILFCSLIFLKKCRIYFFNLDILFKNCEKAISMKSLISMLIFPYSQKMKLGGSTSLRI